MINDKLFLEEFDEEPIEEAKQSTRRRKSKKAPYSSMTITTGDIGLNIDRFNTAFGTNIDTPNTTVTGSTEGIGSGMVESLTEASDKSVRDASTEQVLILENNTFKVLELVNLTPPHVEVIFTSENFSDIENKFSKLAQMWIKKYGDSHTNDVSLTEAKRYVRRYYIRPQNIFCSNKAEIIKALIELDDKNCSVYTLNNLGDDKDVSKLMNSDIIYYYDDGILYDKNRVKVMDYDLSIKKEEERKHFANVDAATDKEFKAEYEDRMTDATELEESQEMLDGEVLDGAFNAILDGIFDTCDYDVISADFTPMGDKVIVTLNHNAYDTETAAEELMTCLDNAGIPTIDWNTNGSNVFIFTLNPDNAFDLDFDDINVYGESLTEAKHEDCCICGEPIEGYGNNPEPYMSADKGRACDSCNLHFIVPMRLEQSKED